MKKRMTNNLGLKILSVLLAFFVWLLVVNVSNPEVTRSQEVPLEIRNESVLLDAQRTYEINRRTVSVAYDIHTLDEYKMRPSDFRAYIDLAELYDITGSVVVKVEILNNSNLIRGVTAKPNVIRVETEELQSKEFKLVTKLKGHPLDNYSVNAINLSPSTITVEGPMSKVGLINSVGIEVDIGRSDGDVTGFASPMFYDANGNTMTVGGKVSTNVSQIQYRVSVSKMRQIPLRFHVSGTAAAGYQYVGYECPADRVYVSGMDDVLLSFTEIDISDPMLNVDGASADKTVVIDLRGHMPEGVTLADEMNPMIEVTLKVEPLASRRINLSETDILLKGMENRWDYQISPSRIVVTLRGLEEELEGVSGSDLEAVIDVTGLEEGVHDAVLTFAESGDYTITDVQKVQIEITNRGPGNEPHEQPERESEETETAANELEPSAEEAGATVVSEPSEADQYRQSSANINPTDEAQQ